jgi:hypothetical protein
MSSDTSLPAGGHATNTTLACATLSLHCLSETFVAPTQLLTLRIGIILGIAIILITQYVRSPWRKVPPGPQGLPILGNALQLKDKSWMFEKDCKQNFSTPSVIPLDSLALQIYQRYSRKHHVVKCARPAHYRL